MVKHSFVLLRIITDSYVTYTGFHKVSHTFENVGTFDSLDSLVLHLFNLPDGRFRVLHHKGKKLKKYSVLKDDFKIIFE